MSAIYAYTALNKDGRRTSGTLSADSRAAALAGAIVWNLLDAERAIGTTLTEAFQIVPEQSTAAIVMHHPQAAYFNAAAVREMAPA